MAWSGEGRSGEGASLGRGRRGVLRSSLGLADSEHPEEAGASGGWGASQAEAFECFLGRGSLRKVSGEEVWEL